MKTSTKILCGATLCCVLFSLTNGAAVIYKEEHDKFFKTLTMAEQEALMALAIAHHDVANSGIFPIVPISPLVRPRAEEIPSRLFNTMINGDVPGNWSKGFIAWLKDAYEITDESLDLFRKNESQQVCQEDDKNCFELKDLGAQCCPFG